MKSACWPPWWCTLGAEHSPCLENKERWREQLSMHRYKILLEPTAGWVGREKLSEQGVSSMECRPGALERKKCLQWGTWKPSLWGHRKEDTFFRIQRSWATQETTERGWNAKDSTQKADNRKFVCKPFINQQLHQKSQLTSAGQNCFGFSCLCSSKAFALGTGNWWYVLLCGLQGGTHNLLGYQTMGLFCLPPHSKTDIAQKKCISEESQLTCFEKVQYNINCPNFNFSEVFSRMQFKLL